MKRTFLRMSLRWKFLFAKIHTQFIEVFMCMRSFFLTVWNNFDVLYMSVHSLNYTTDSMSIDGCYAEGKLLLLLLNGWTLAFSHRFLRLSIFPIVIFNWRLCMFFSSSSLLFTSIRSIFMRKFSLRKNIGWIRVKVSILRMIRISFINWIYDAGASGMIWWLPFDLHNKWFLVISFSIRKIQYYFNQWLGNYHLNF